MPLTSAITGSVCSKMSSEVNKILGVVKSFDSMISAQLNAIKTLLSHMSFSPASVINANAAKLLANMSKMVPNLGQFDGIMNMIAACAFLGKSPNVSPTSLIKGSIGDIKSNAMGLVTSLTGGLPEFNGAQLFNALKGQLKLSGIPTGILNINAALGCLTSICGSDISSQVSQLNGILSKYYLSATTGELDPKALMAAAGLSSDKINNMMNCVSSIDNITVSIESVAAAAAAKAKNAGTATINRISPLKDKITSFIPF